MIAEWQSRVRAQERAEAGVSSWVRFRVRSSVSSLQTLSQSQHVNIKSSQTKCWVFFSVCQPKQSEFLCQQESLMHYKVDQNWCLCLCERAVFDAMGMDDFCFWFRSQASHITQSHLSFCPNSRLHSIYSSRIEVSVPVLSPVKSV